MFGVSQLFASSEEQSTRAPSLTVISRGMTFRGASISGTGDLRIEGTVWSDVSVEGRVFVASGGEVYGTVHAQSIMVAGTVEGRLQADGKLVLRPEAVVSATLRMRTLRIDSGAQFEGRVQPLESEPAEALSLDDEEASTSIPSPPVTSSSDEHDRHFPERSSSTAETASASSEETSSRDGETEEEPSVSSSVDASSSNTEDEVSDESKGDESSYGFQW